MEFLETKDGLFVKGLCDFSLSHIFDCGQCFRFEKQGEGGYLGVAFGRVLYCREVGEGVVFSTTKEEFDRIWRPFFDLDRDYAPIKIAFATDEFTKAAATYGSGIRILKQEPWEALASFILSQCNNIPRIKGIVDRLCTTLGEPIQQQGHTLYTFPSPQRIAACSLKDLEPLRCGYRGPYLLNAAKAVCEGAFSFGALEDMTLKEARAACMTLTGVGAKVADCFLLFGMGKLDAFPVDTWMKKARSFYKGDMDPTTYGAYAGIYQQYIFYYARALGL